MADRSTVTFFVQILILSFLIGAATPLVDGMAEYQMVTGLVGGVSGILIGAGCVTAEMAFLSNRDILWLRRLPIIAVVVLRALAYSLIILFGIIVPSLVFRGVVMWRDPDFGFNFFFSAAIAIGISMAVELVRLLGREAAVDMFTGRYRRPRIENRIIMFADLVGSTALAEKLGDLRFHEFLADVSYDVSVPISKHRGETHRYVGDAIIVTWSMDASGNFDRSLACAQAMIDTLRGASATYQARYGQTAAMRIALHCGPVAAGEIGAWKKEIALLGDTMNTAARIENAARDYGADIVVSGAVFDHLSDPHQNALMSLPAYRARGKQDQLALWGASPGT